MSSLVAAAIAACAGARDVDTTAEPLSWSTLPPPSGPTTIETPVGLALDIEDGVAVPFKVRKNQRFYLNQIDLRAHIDRTVDEGVAGLDQLGDFAALDWRDTSFADQSFVNTPNPDGTFTRRRMYRKARWMDDPSVFVIEQLDTDGHRSGASLVVDTGLEYIRTDTDSFFARRLRAIQWTNDCASKTDCSTANSFMEEALVELRYANGPNPNIRLEEATTQLRVTWSANAQHPYTIPVQQIDHPAWDYGFGIDLAVTTPPAGDGAYAPGQGLTVKFTLRDGSGKALHPPGVLPTFLDYLTGNDPPGIDYWNVNEKVMTYYRRKHKEQQMVIAINGPMQDTGPIRDTLDFIGGIVTSPDGSVTVATSAAQGFFWAAAAVPAWRTLIGVDPPDSPVGDTARFTLPPNAAPGTYKIVMKARRSYLSQEIPMAKVIEIQVGTTRHTTKTLDTGPCTSCHEDGSDLTRVNHAISAGQRDVCTTCHVPLPFEPEGPIYVRTHFVHSRTDRLDAPLFRCSNCHVDRQGIQRTSKSACLSCHKSYPPDHVVRYGPIVDMYIGGTLEDSFQPCSTTCHTNHPAGGL
jgi:hypothetical protein